MSRFVRKCENCEFCEKSQKSQNTSPRQSVSSLFIRELKHARFRDAGGNRKRTFRVPGLSGVSQIFILIISNEENILVDVMWLCEDKLKEKTAHSRLPSVSQKRACLNSLLVEGECSHHYATPGPQTTSNQGNPFHESESGKALVTLYFLRSPNWCVFYYVTSSHIGLPKQKAESIYIKIELNARRFSLVIHRGRHFFVLEDQHGRRDVL